MSYFADGVSSFKAVQLKTRLSVRPFKSGDAEVFSSLRGLRHWSEVPRALRILSASSNVGFLAREEERQQIYTTYLVNFRADSGSSTASLEEDRRDEASD